jgi:uroporphyrinogen-III synthase
LLAEALARPTAFAWLLSSSEAVDHLAALAPRADWSGALALASHPRIAERAERLGFGRVLPVRPAAEEVAGLLLGLG